MNLLLVNYEYPPLGGGAGNATAYIARELAALGHQPFVVTSRYRDLAGWRDENGIRVMRLPSPRRRVDRSNLVEMAAFVALACAIVPSLIRKQRIDGMIVFFSLPCGPIGLLAKQRTGCPYVLSLRGGDVPGAEASLTRLQQLLAPLRRAAMRGAHAVIANSHGLAQMSQRADPIAVDVIPNGVDTTFFNPRETASDQSELRLLFAGRFQEQKNLFELLRQFASALTKTRMPMRLTMVGDGPQREDLIAHADRLCISDCVRWSGWLDKTALADAYRDCDIFVNPSLYEGMPNTVMEAMACGLPVIASDVAGNNELVRHGASGLLFPVADPERLADAITTMAKDIHFRRDCGHAARQIAVAEYTWNATARRYVDFFLQDSAS